LTPFFEFSVTFEPEVQTIAYQLPVFFIIWQCVYWSKLS